MSGRRTHMGNAVVAAALLCFGVAYVVPSGAVAAQAAPLSVRRIQLVGAVAVVDVSVPMALSGATLPDGAFSVSNGNSGWNAVGAQRTLNPNARLAVFVDGTFDPPAVRQVQAALLQLVGDLDPSMSLVLGVNGSVSNVAMDRAAALDVVRRFDPPSPPSADATSKMYRQVLLTAVGPSASVVVTNSTGGGGPIRATDIVDGPVVALQLGSAGAAGWLSDLASRTGGQVVTVALPDQTSSIMLVVFTALRSLYRLVVPLASGGLPAEVRVNALGVDQSAALAVSAPAMAPVAPPPSEAPAAPPSTVPSQSAADAVAPSSSPPISAAGVDSSAPETTTPTTDTASGVINDARTGASASSGSGLGWLLIVALVLIAAAVGVWVFVRRVLPRRRAAGAALERIKVPAAPPAVAATSMRLDPSEIDEAGLAAEQAIADLVAHRQAPGLHVAPVVFNAMEAAASAWLADPNVRVPDLLAYLVRQADRSSTEHRSPALDHIAVAESRLFADLTAPVPVGASAESLIETAVNAAELLAAAGSNGPLALQTRSRLAAWPARHTPLGVVAVVLSPSLTDDEPDRAASNDERALILLRALADGARRMLRAERALLALHRSYEARLGATPDPSLVAALDVALTQLVVRRERAGARRASGRLNRSSAVRAAPVLPDDLVAAMEALGWLVRADDLEGTTHAADSSSLWLAAEAFERISSAFADAHVEHLDPRSTLVLPTADHDPATHHKEPHHAL